LFIIYHFEKLVFPDCLYLENKKAGEKQAFRAIRRALYMLSDYTYGILTDTNSSVANLAPWQEKDPSVSGKQY
jgi:hypothetical protein